MSDIREKIVEILNKLTYNSFGAGEAPAFFDVEEYPPEKAADEIINLLPKWIPVSERLPENFQTVLVYIGRCPDSWWAYIATQYIEGRFHCNQHDLVTHWMPLPEPPKDSK